MEWLIVLSIYTLIFSRELQRFLYRSDDRFRISLTANNIKIGICARRTLFRNCDTYHMSSYYAIVYSLRHNKEVVFNLMKSYYSKNEAIRTGGGKEPAKYLN